MVKFMHSTYIQTIIISECCNRFVCSSSSGIVLKYVSPVGDLKRLKSLRNPAKKMSKSDTDANSRIELTDSDDVIRQKLKKAVSDFTSYISYEPENRPAISNLVNIHAAFTDLLPEEIVEESLALDTLAYKERVADVVIANLAPIRKEIVRLRGDTSYLDEVIRSGADRAAGIATDTYDKVKQLVGFT